MLMTTHGEVVTLVHPAESIPPDRTVIWSPLFQAAWDQLNTQIAAPLLRVEPPNDVTTRLDSFKWDASKVMPLGSWKTWCGPSTFKFLEVVNKEASAMVKHPVDPFNLPSEAENSFAFFGLLEREVKFFREFYHSHTISLNFKSKDKVTPVEFFGVKGDLSSGFSDVKVLDYQPESGSHLLEVDCQETDDRVVLYLPKEPGDFTSACKFILEMRAKWDTIKREPGKVTDAFIHGGDDIRVPVLKFGGSSDLQPRLTGLRFYQGKDLPYLISRAEQSTRFELDSKGARVRVSTSGGMDPFGGPIKGVPRSFIYDRPFFVFLWRAKAEWLYFAAWIGDASSLTVFSKN